MAKRDLEYNIKFKAEDRDWITKGPEWCRTARAWAARQVTQTVEERALKQELRGPVKSTITEKLQALADDEDPTEDEDNSLWAQNMKECEICHMEFNCEKTATNHYMGHRHRAMVKMLKMKKTRDYLLKAQGVDPSRENDNEVLNYHVESENSRANKKGRLADDREAFLHQIKDLPEEDQLRLREERVQQMNDKNVQPSFYATKQFIKEAAFFRDEFATKVRSSWQHHPGNVYIQERMMRDQERQMKGLPVPKPVQVPEDKRPKALGEGTSAEPVPLAIEENKEAINNDEPPAKKARMPPVMTDNLCSVCNVEFCGPVPAKQHYDGQKHRKKMKQYDDGLLEPSAVVKATPRRVEEAVVAKVGMNLEYCELCELKLSDNPITAARHYSSKEHLKFMKIGVDSPGIGLPGKSSIQRGEEQRQFTGTWADKVDVSEVPQWGRQRFNRMGHHIKMKGVGAGPGKQPIPGEEESECRFCDGFL